MGQDNNTNTDERTWKTILADHVGKALATVIIAAGTTYLGIKFQSENKPNTADNSVESTTSTVVNDTPEVNDKPHTQRLVTFKIATIIEAAKRINPRLTRLKVRTDNEGDVVIILENSEIDFNSLKIGKKINVAGEFRTPGSREPALFITKNSSQSYLKIID